MRLAIFLFLQLATAVLSAHLRSSQTPWVDDARSEDFSLMVAEVGPPTTASKSVADELADEHLYFAKKCSDCVYKSDQCGCQPTVEYFACVTKHCHPAKDPAFADKCSARKNACGSELEIECLGEKTFCKSKFHQLPKGGLGLAVDVNEDEAFCGPFGKCLGHLAMSVKIIRRVKEAAPQASLPKVINFVAGPASAPIPAPAPTAAAPAPAAMPPPAPKTPPAPPAPPIWFECGLPKVDKPDINKKADWITSQAEAKDDKARLELPLPKTWIKAAEGRKVYCVLKDSKDGKRLTQPAWTAVTNVHAKEEDKEEGKVGEKEPEKENKNEGKSMKQGKKDDFAKPPWMADKAQAKLAEKKVENVEKVEKKEEKREKKAEKKEEKVEKKAEKKVEKAVKKEEDVAKKEEKAVEKEVKKAEFGQPPWMADKAAKDAKEAEHAEKKAAIVEAKAAEENKKREDVEKANKDAANEKLKIDNNSGLPWMKGKANAPAFGA